MAGSMGIALQGLNVAMRGFETASSNIANVNTPGYSRQQVELTSRAAPEQGVQVLNVSRIADSFATQQLWSSQAAFAESSQYSFLAGQVDDLLANPNTNISAVTDQFFAALQTGVDDPASIPNRELIFVQSESLALRFVEVDRQLQAQSDAVNAKLEGTVNEANQMAGLVAELNDKIRLADARGEAANELKDHRDELILSISEKMGVSVQTSTGSTDINLFVGNGQPLVLGGTASTLSAQPGDPDIDDFDVFVKIGDKQISVGDEIRTGEIGGMLDFKNEVLIPSRNELGRLAIVFADTVNQQQAKGLDLDGNMGGDWFKDPAKVGVVRPFSGNQTELKSTSGVEILDSGLLKASDYEVQFGSARADGSGLDFTVTRKSDGKVFTQDDFKARTASLDAEYENGTLSQSDGELLLNLDGLAISLKSDTGRNFSNNDQFLVQPVRTGAEHMEVALSSGRELAFASPVRAETAIDNGGTLSVEMTTVNNLAPRTGQLVSVDLSADINPASNAVTGVALPKPSPVLVYFTSETTYSVYQGPAPTPASAFDPVTATLYDFGHDFDSGAGVVTTLENKIYDPEAGIDIAVGDPGIPSGLVGTDGKAYHFQVHPSDVEFQLAEAQDPSRADVEALQGSKLQLVFGKDGNNQDTYTVFQIDNDDPTNSKLFLAAKEYTPGESIQLNGFEITLNGTPKPGDKLNLEFNTDAVSDNRNALQLSELQRQSLVEGTASYQDNYGSLVEEVGSRTQVANISLQANEAIMQSAQSIRDGISGVNLDEEAANLIKFQQQYQAASQVINTARSMFDTLLSSVG
ncbi:MAG: flagellar hook-associated protein FlgK [Motiliproteus sp.]